MHLVPKPAVTGLLALMMMLAQPLHSSSPTVLALRHGGTLSWTNTAAARIDFLESAPSHSGPWSDLGQQFTLPGSNAVGVPLPGAAGFFRLETLEIPADDTGFARLIASYGIIETIAGNGTGYFDGPNYWDPAFEGGPATNATLSRPHFAMADRAGNVLIVDKNSHSVLSVDLDGNIHTVAGSHEAGFNGDGPAPATSLSLSSPNGLWVRPDGSFYVLDTGNGKVRRVANGVMQTLFTDEDGISGGRGLWVSENEKLVYFGDGTRLDRWTPKGGVSTVADSFSELGNFVVRPDGQLVVTDRGAGLVYLVDPAGHKTLLAGLEVGAGGGDGAPGLETDLPGARGVWPLPPGGYLLATHKGSQLWYLDAAGIIHLFVDGTAGAHDGDGGWFHAGGPKVSELRSVSLDSRGNIVIVENDFGYVRRIRFQRIPDL